jgi:predicted nucleic acid-binding protein
MPIESLTPQVERLAIDVQGILADRDENRAPSIPDLLIAATAELCGLIVLHQDTDFDLIAGISGQRVERLRTT